MRLLVIQNTVFESIATTLSSIETMIASRKQAEFDMLILPEMFTSPYQVDLFQDYAQSDDTLVPQTLSRWAKTYQAYVIGGTVPEMSDAGFYNTSYVFDRSGQQMLKYRKIHLFSVVYPNGTHFDERESFQPGINPGVFTTEFGDIGLMICFDIRFPLLAHELMRRDVKMIVVPGAFNDYTGPLHWETTFRARAIDNQLFLVGCSASNESYGSYQTYGHSIVVDPLGKVIKELDGLPGIIEVHLPFHDVDAIRERLPIVKNPSKYN